MLSENLFYNSSNIITNNSIKETNAQGTSYNRGFASVWLSEVIEQLHYLFTLEQRLYICTVHSTPNAKPPTVVGDFNEQQYIIEQ